MADLYELRAMRAMRQSALQRGALAILDLGSTKIGCLILRFDGLDPSLASIKWDLWGPVIVSGCWICNNPLSWN